MFTISVWRWSYVQLLYSPFSSVHFHLPTNILSVLCRFQLLGEFDLKDLNSFWFLQNITFSSRVKRAPKSLIVSTFFQSSNEAPVFHARDPAQVIVNTPCLEYLRAVERPFCRVTVSSDGAVHFLSVLKRNRSTAGNVQSHFRKMADEKTAKGKPFPKEEVDFVLIGAGWWVDRTSTTVSIVL